MGFRMRKSFKVAPGVRLNVSKSGFGVSVGGKGGRYSVHSSGRRTVSAGSGDPRRLLPAVRRRRQERPGASARSASREGSQARTLRPEGREGAIQRHQGAERRGDPSRRLTSIPTSARLVQPRRSHAPRRRLGSGQDPAHDCVRSGWRTRRDPFVLKYLAHPHRASDRRRSERRAPAEP